VVIVVLLAVCVVSLAGWWWLGKTATPGQRAIEERIKARHRAMFKIPAIPTMFGRGTARGARDPEWWTRTPSTVVPEPDEHKEAWRDGRSGC
jgi:hypothetical protein